MDIKKVLQEVSAEASTISSEVKEISRVHAELLKIEVEECKSFLIKKIVAAVLLAGTAFFLLCVLLTTMISAIGIAVKSYLPEAIQQYSWHIVAVVVAIIFLIVIATCVSLLKKKPGTPFFDSSKKEFNNNKLWLQNLSKSKSNSSSVN